LIFVKRLRLLGCRTGGTEVAQGICFFRPLRSEPHLFEELGALYGDPVHVELLINATAVD
jgi:hypothetical protein